MSPSLPTILSAAAVLASLIALTLALVPEAFGHDWYPMECCHELRRQENGTFMGDCGIADLVAQTPAGTVIRQRETGITVTIPPDFPKHKLRQNTHDSNYHVCVVANYAGGNEPYIYCLFEPSGS